MIFAILKTKQKAFISMFFVIAFLLSIILFIKLRQIVFHVYKVCVGGFRLRVFVYRMLILLVKLKTSCCAGLDTFPTKWCHYNCLKKEIYIHTKENLH